MNQRFKRSFLGNLKEKSVNFDWYLLGAVVTLVVIGLAFLASALPVKNEIVNGYVSFQHEFFKQLIFGVWIGGVSAFILSRIDYHQIFKYKHIIIAITLGSLLYIAIPLLFADFLNLFGATVSRQDAIGFFEVFGIYPVEVNNAVRWLSIFNITNFQPSEFAKLGVLIYFAAFLNKYESFTWDNFKKPIYAFLLTSICIILQPDLGSIVVMFLVVLAALWMGKIPVKIISFVMLFLVLFGGFFTLREDYRRDRVLVWMSQSFCAEENNGGFMKGVCDKVGVEEKITTDDKRQTNNVRKALVSGGVWGVGYGNSEVKSSIPEVTTDGIIGIIGAEMGFVFVLFVLILYVFIFWRGIKIAKEAPDVGGTVLATGISVWIVFQAFWNVSGMIGLMPMKGLPLPFISEGGTAMLINLSAIGILLNISSQTELFKKKPVNFKNKIKKRRKRLY